MQVWVCTGIIICHVKDFLSFQLVMSRRCKVPFSRRAYYRSHGGGLFTDEESLSQYSVHPVPNAEPTRNEYAKINSCDMSHGDTTPHGDLNVSVDSNCNHGNPTCLQV